MGDIFSWVGDLIEDLQSLLSKRHQELDNEALGKLKACQQKLPEVWTENGQPPQDVQQQLSDLVKDAEELVQIIDHLQASIEHASEIVREGDKKIDHQVQNLENMLRSI